MTPESRAIVTQWLSNKAQKQLEVAVLRSAFLSSLLQNKEQLVRLEQLRTKWTKDKMQTAVSSTVGVKAAKTGMRVVKKKNHVHRHHDSPAANQNRTSAVNMSKSKDRARQSAISGGRKRNWGHITNAPALHHHA
jgi:hypothetical protein